jgi:hypothetical protein
MDRYNEIIPSMKARRLLLMIGVLAACAGCSRDGGTQKAYGAKETYSYLQEVGQIRLLINTDNKDRIPAMIRGQDAVMLGAQGAKTEEYRQTLIALKAVGVDPEALMFKKNLEAILDSYRSVCLDTAELFREIKAANARPSGPHIDLPPAIFGSLAYKSDTLGTIDSLLESLGRMDVNPGGGAVSLKPIVDKVREDRDKLKSAKVTHHDFTNKLKAEFPLRYPDLDWTSKEILP